MKKARDDVRTRHDEWVKRAFALWLGDLGDVVLDARLAGQSRRGDVLYTERYGRPALRRKLGTLGDLARGEVLFEISRNPLTELDLMSGVAKLIELAAHEIREDHVRAVGWLSAKHAFIEGEVPTEFLARLREFAGGLRLQASEVAHQIRELSIVELLGAAVLRTAAAGAVLVCPFSSPHARVPGVVDSLSMTAAHPLSLDDDLDVFPLDDLSALPPEVRAAVERAEEEGASGRVVSHATIEEGLREMQRRDG